VLALAIIASIGIFLIFNLLLRLRLPLGILES
jgi:hypothetical protein